MKESVIYQEIQSIGEANLILRLLQKRFGTISVDLTEKIRKYLNYE